MQQVFGLLSAAPHPSSISLMGGFRMAGKLITHHHEILFCVASASALAFSGRAAIRGRTTQAVLSASAALFCGYEAYSARLWGVVAGLQALQADLRVEVASLREIKKELEPQVTALTEQVHQLAEEIGKLEKQNALLATTNETSRENAEELTKKIQELNRTHADISSNVASMSALAQTIAQGIASLKEKSVALTENEQQILTAAQLAIMTGKDLASQGEATAQSLEKMVAELAEKVTTSCAEQFQAFQFVQSAMNKQFDEHTGLLEAQRASFEEEKRQAAEALRLQQVQLQLGGAELNELLKQTQKARAALEETLQANNEVSKQLQIDAQQSTEANRRLSHSVDSVVGFIANSPGRLPKASMASRDVPLPPFAFAPYPFGGPPNYFET